MKTDLSLVELAANIQSRAARKEDFVSPSSLIRARTDRTSETVRQLMSIGTGSHEREFTINDHAHGQLASVLSIPNAYYDRMRADVPDLWETSVNRWLDQEPMTRRMIRTIDGGARAVLSDRYSRMDDEHFAETVLPAISEVKGAEVVSCAITDTKTHIKFVSRLLLRDIKPGDTVAFGIAFSNSEVGAGALSGAFFTERLVCTNGMISATDVFRSAHLGGRHSSGRDLGEIFQLDTVNADARATILKLRDYAREMLTDRFIDEHVDKLRAASGVVIHDPIDTVTKLAKNYGMTEGEKKSVLTHLINGADLSLFGLAQAVTRSAEDLPDYNRATEFERMGGKLITVNRTEAKALALAA